MIRKFSGHHIWKVPYLVIVHSVMGCGLFSRSLAASRTLAGSGISCGFRMTNLDAYCRSGRPGGSGPRSGDLCVGAPFLCVTWAGIHLAAS